MNEPLPAGMKKQYFDLTECQRCGAVSGGRETPHRPGCKGRKAKVGLGWRLVAQ